MKTDPPLSGRSDLIDPSCLGCLFLLMIPDVIIWGLYSLYHINRFLATVVGVGVIYVGWSLFRVPNTSSE